MRANHGMEKSLLSRSFHLRSRTLREYKHFLTEKRAKVSLVKNKNKKEEEKRDNKKKEKKKLRRQSGCIYTLYDALNIEKKMKEKDRWIERERENGGEKIGLYLYYSFI